MAPLLIILVVIISFYGKTSSISVQNAYFADLEAIEELVSTYKKKTMEVRNKINNLSSELEDFAVSLNNNKQTRVDSQTKISNQTDAVKNTHKKHARVSTKPSVGFFATMTTHNENLNLQDTVKFQNLVTNDGNAFDHITGIFRAPVSGIYYFSVVILSHPADDMETEIVKNGDGIVRTYSGDSKLWKSGTQTTVLYLEVGDQVWIRILDAVPAVNDGNVHVFGYGFSSFSGFLISE